MVAVPAEVPALLVGSVDGGPEGVVWGLIGLEVGCGERGPFFSWALNIICLKGQTDITCTAVCGSCGLRVSISSVMLFE